MHRRIKTSRPGERFSYSNRIIRDGRGTSLPKVSRRSDSVRSSASIRSDSSELSQSHQSKDDIRYYGVKSQYAQRHRRSISRESSLRGHRIQSPSHGKYRRQIPERRLYDEKSNGSSSRIQSLPGEKYQKTESSTVILSNLPDHVTEDSIEAIVRNDAISLKFSPPNLVRIFELNNEKQALVDFPSVDAAADFIVTCSSQFKINDKTITLKQASVPPGTLSSLINTTTTDDLARIMLKTNFLQKRVVSDGSIPLVDSTRNQKSQSQVDDSMISFTADIAGDTNTCVRLEQDSTDLLGKDSDSKRHTDSPGRSKASAIASILASAQLAAAATKQVVKSKNLVPTFVGCSTSKKDIILEDENYFADEAPTMEQVFVAPDEEVLFENDGCENSSVPSRKLALNDKNGFEESNSTIIGFEPSHVCFICIRAFSSAEKLKCHELTSLLHKKNAASQLVDSSAFTSVI